MATEGTGGAQTVRRALGLLATVVDEQPVPLTELAAKSGLTMSTTHRLMRTLEAEGFLSREPGGRSYVVGSELIVLSARVIHGLGVRDVVHPVMQQLVDLTGETVSLHVRAGERRTCIDTVEGIHPIRRVIAVGETLPLYAGPSGKVMLAHVDAEDAEAILAQAAQAGQDVERIRGQLASIREVGYMGAIADRTPGVGGFSVPLFGPAGVMASMTTSGPDDRWSLAAMGAVAATVVSHAETISRRLGGVPAPVSA